MNKHESYCKAAPAEAGPHMKCYGWPDSQPERKDK